MLELWGQEFELPHYTQLKRTNDKDLSPQLRNILRTGKPDVRCAVKKMIAYVALTRGLSTTEITLDHLVEADVGEAASAYRKHWRLLSPIFQHFLVEAGRERTRPMGNRRYKEYHPLLLDWIKVKASSVRITAQYRTVGMQFLSWITSKYYLAYTEGQFPVSLLSRDVLLHYRQHLLNQTETSSMSRVYLKRHMALVVEWVRWLIAEHKVSDINLTRLAISGEKNRERTLPTEQQIERLIDGAVTISQPKIVLMLLMMLATGARPSELCYLTLGDINMEEHSLKLQSKGGPERKIRLPDSLWEMTVNHLGSTFVEMTMDPSLRVFLNRAGTPMEYWTLKRQMQRIRKATGIKIDGLMALRHKFATDCLEAHVPTNVFLYLMGQTGVSEKGRYQHVERGFHQSEINRAFNTIPWKDDFNV